MKNLRTPFALCLVTALSLACSSKSTEDQSNQNAAENYEIQEATPVETPESNISTIAFKDESTTQIFNSYLALKDALVETDGEKVNEEAKKLNLLLADEKYNSINSDVQKIMETTDPKIQRESFESLSEQMILLAKSSELISGNLFLQHCPMANGNKGANWLSLSEEIRNPYFGDRMLKCGSVTGKI